MRYRKLDFDDDYSFGNSEQDFLRDTPETVGQAAKTRLLLWLGEYFLNTSEGTPYLEGILGKHSKDIADANIQDRVLNTQGVTGISKYESTIDPDTRAMTVNISINTLFGPTAVQLLNYRNF